MSNWFKRVARKDSVNSTLLVGEEDRTTHTGYTAGKGRSCEDFEDLYERYARARLVTLFPNSMFYAGFSSETQPKYVVPADKNEEMRQAVIQAEKFGWSIIVASGINPQDKTSGTNIQAWGPKCNGVGAEPAEFDAYGIPTVMSIYYDPKDSSKKTDVPKQNFFILRTGDRLGWKGISKLLPVYDIILMQQQIIEVFTQTCRNAAISFLHVDDPHATTDAQITALNTAIGNIRSLQKLVTGGGKTLTPISLMDKSYDPINIVNKCDEFICSVFLIPKSLLTGDPSGHLSSSREANAQFYNRVKEIQSYYYPQLQPVLKRIGAPDDIQFIDPTEMTQQEKAEFLAVVSSVLEKLNVGDDQVINFVNDELGTEFTIDMDKQVLKQFQISSLLQNKPAEGNGNAVTEGTPVPKKATKKVKPNGQAQ